MLLLDFGVRSQSPPELSHGPVRLRAARLGDFDQWAALREKSREHLTAWEPAWREIDLTRDAFRIRLRMQQRDIRRGAALPMLVFREEDDAMVGGITLSNIRYGAARAGAVGYWIGAAYKRRGYTRAALGAVLEHAFRRLGLNRVEAASQPGNIASIALLDSTGFTREGLARRYLRINGEWRDHVLFAITSDDYFAMPR